MCLQNQQPGLYRINQPIASKTQFENLILRKREGFNILPENKNLKMRQISRSIVTSDRVSHLSPFLPVIASNRFIEQENIKQLQKDMKNTFDSTSKYFLLIGKKLHFRTFIQS